MLPFVKALHFSSTPEADVRHLDLRYFVDTRTSGAHRCPEVAGVVSKRGNYADAGYYYSSHLIFDFSFLGWILFSALVLRLLLFEIFDCLGVQVDTLRLCVKQRPDSFDSLPHAL